MTDLVPKYATLNSIIASATRDGRINSATSVIAPFQGQLDPINYLGERSTELGRPLLGESADADELLLRHSHFSFFGNLLSEGQEECFENGLLAGDSQSATLKSHLLAFGALEAETLRRCPQCVGEDVARYGRAHWRIFHQFPIARHCVAHGCRLQTCCAACKATIARSDRPLLPDDACEACGHDRFSASSFKASPGYWQTLRLMNALLTCEVPRARPEMRRVIWERARDFWSRRGQFRNPYIHTLDAWKCDSIERLAKLLGCLKPGSDEQFDITSVLTLAPTMLVAVLATVDDVA